MLSFKNYSNLNSKNHIPINLLQNFILKILVSNGFILNKKELIPTAYETWQAVQEVIDSAINTNLEKRAKLNSSVI